MSQHALKAQELADRLGGALQDCPPDRLLTEVLPLEEAGPTSVSFLANPKYQRKAKESRAGLIIAEARAELEGRPRVLMANPYWGFAQATGWLHPEPAPEWSEGPIHPLAVIAPDARIAPGVSVGARTVIGARCLLHPGVHIGDDCVLGEDCELFSGVVLYRKTKLGDRVRIHANTVLGSDGFGYVTVAGRQEKVPQVGWVEVGDDAEIGACTTVDRGALGPTRIGAGTKVDNLVQLAHNVRTGSHCLIAAQTGLSGSTTLGDHVTLAGRSASTGHLHIGSRAILSGNAVAAKDVPEGIMVSGYPARPHRDWMAVQAALHRLPGLLRKLTKD